MGERKSLSAKEEMFCQFYAELGNATNAYKESYSCSNMKPTTVNNKASVLLKKDKIRKRVDEIRDEMNERCMLKKEDALMELTNIVNARITGLGEIRGNKFTVKDMNDIPDNLVSCIQSVKSTRDGIEVKLYDKISAIDRLSKMLGWDKPTNNNSTVRIVVGDE